MLFAVALAMIVSFFRIVTIGMCSELDPEKR